MVMADPPFGSGAAGAAVPAVPSGTRALAETVRADVPGLQAAVRRMLTGVVLAEAGWAGALDVALEHPELTVVTVAGDRFGGRGPWRLGGEAVGVTRAAWEEAQQQAVAAAAAAAAAEQTVKNARIEFADRQQEETTTREAARVGAAALEDVRRSLIRVDEERGQRVAEAEATAAEEIALREQHTDDLARVAELELRLPVLEAAALEARSLFETHVEAQRELDARIDAVATRRSRLDVRAAQVEERREVLQRRLAEVEERLARDPERRAQAEQHRSELEQRGHGYAIVAAHLDALLERTDALLARWRLARRAEAERAAEAGRQLEQLRKLRVEAERELVEIREHLQRRDVEEAETRLRLETAVERLRTEFDVEPAVALDAPAPEVPGGTTLAGRARELERELRLMGPINPLALEEHDALHERHQFLQEQLEDVKASRRELNRVIRAVDHEIITCSSTARSTT